MEFQLRVLSLYGSPWFELLRSDNGAREKNWGNGFCSVSVFKEESDWKKVKRKRKGKGKGKKEICGRVTRNEGEEEEAYKRN